MRVFSSMHVTSTARDFDFNLIFCNCMNKMALRALGHAAHVMRDEDAREGRRAGAVQQRRVEDTLARRRRRRQTPARARCDGCAGTRAANRLYDPKQTVCLKRCGLTVTKAR